MAKTKQKKKRNRFRENYEFFSYLAKLPTSRQKVLIKAADRDILIAFSEIALNLMKKNIPLSKKQKNKLKPYARQIYHLSLKGKSIKHKKKIVQKGGLLGGILSILPILLSTVLGSR